MIGEPPFDVGGVSVRTPLGEEGSVIGGEIRSLRPPGFVRNETAVQKEDRVALALDLVPSPDTGKFDVLAHRSLPPSIAAQTLHTIAHFARLLEPLFTVVPRRGILRTSRLQGSRKFGSLP